MEIKKAIADLAVLAVGILVVDVIFEAVGLSLAQLNTAVANLNSYVNVSTLAGIVTAVVPIVEVVFIIAAIFVLLELFGAQNILNFS